MADREEFDRIRNELGVGVVMKSGAPMEDESIQSALDALVEKGLAERNERGEYKLTEQGNTEAGAMTAKAQRFAESVLVVLYENPASGAMLVDLLTSKEFDRKYVLQHLDGALAHLQSEGLIQPAAKP